MLNLKAKLIAAGAFLLSVLAFFLRLKVVTNQRDKAREKAEKYQAWSERQQATSLLDSEIESEYSELKRQENDGKVPDNLSKPNDF